MRPDSTILIAGPLRLDLANERLWKDGEGVALRTKPFLLLRALMRHPQQLVSKRELIEAGWGDLPVTDAVLTTAIKELRKALGDSARQPYAVENVHGRGYRFLLAVTEAPVGAPLEPQALPQETSAGADVPAAPTVAPPVPPTRESAPTDVPRRPFPRWPGALAVAALLLFGVWRFANRQAPDGVVDPSQAPPERAAGEEVLETPAPSRRSIAVLPLDDFSPDGSNRWFADGLAEEILNVLAQSPDLAVVSRTSTSRYRGGGSDAREIAEALGVAYLLEGSVRSAGDRLRITLQLIRAEDGLHVFSESWNRPLSVESVFSVQQEVSAQVLRALDAALITPGGVAGTGVPDMDYETYVAVLRARELQSTREPERLTEALGLLQGVVEEAPAHGPAYAAMAISRLLGASSGVLDYEIVKQEAARDIEVAMTLAPDDGEVHNAAALLALMQGDNAAALVHADRAVALAPSLADAHYRRGVILNNLGRFADGAEALRRSSLLDPLSPIRTHAIMIQYMAEGDAAAALETGRRNLKWNPQNNVAIAGMGQILLQTGDYAQAHALLGEAFERAPGQVWNQRYLGLMLWRVGLDDEVMSLDEGQHWLAQGAVLASRGDANAAVARVRPRRQEQGLDLTPLSVLYWARSAEEAIEVAREQIEMRHLANPERPLGYRSEPTQALALLESIGDPLADVLRKRLADFFTHWDPSAEHMLATTLYQAAAWRMLEGKRAEAIALLENAARRGYVYRELALDPVFDGVREDRRYISVLSTMEETARQARLRIAEQLATDDAALGGA